MDGALSNVLIDLHTPYFSSSFSNFLPFPFSFFSFSLFFPFFFLFFHTYLFGNTINIKGILGRERGKGKMGEKWGKIAKKKELRKTNQQKKHGRAKKRTPEKTIRLHLALRGGVARPHRPFAPAYRPVIGSIIKGEKLIKVGGGSHPTPNPPFCTGLSAGDRIKH